MVIFLDLDGTIIDIQRRHFETYALCVDHYGGVPLHMDEYWKLKRSDTSWKYILKKSGMQYIEEREFLAIFTQHIEEREFLDKDTLFPWSIDALEQLSTRNTLILVSLRRSRENLLNQLESLGIMHYFSQILSGHGKTKEDTLNKKANIIQANVAGSGKVFIGDTEADIQAAKQLGVVSIALTSGIRDERFLRMLSPDHIVKNLGDALRIVKTVR